MKDKYKIGIVVILFIITVIYAIYMDYIIK